MRNSFWNDLVAMIDSRRLNYNPAGFIIDTPWISGWNGISPLYYYSSDELLLTPNFKSFKLYFTPNFFVILIFGKLIYFSHIKM